MKYDSSNIFWNVCGYCSDKESDILVITFLLNKIHTTDHSQLDRLFNFLILFNKWTILKLENFPWALIVIGFKLWTEDNGHFDNFALHYVKKPSTMPTIALYRKCAIMIFTRKTILELKQCINIEFLVSNMSFYSVI